MVSKCVKYCNKQNHQSNFHVFWTVSTHACLMGVCSTKASKDTPINLICAMIYLLFVICDLIAC